jgi:hypothetical protein
MYFCGRVKRVPFMKGVVAEVDYEGMPVKNVRT